MKSLLALAVLVFGCGLLSTGRLAAQDWTTIGNDAQRSGWIRSDSKISTDSVKKPDFELLWKMQFDNEPRLENALSPPVLLDFLISHRGFRSLAFVGGSEGNVLVVDTDLARLEWERRFGVVMNYPDPTPQCPGGMTASLTRPTRAALPALGGMTGFGYGRRSAGVSAVGEPDEGAVTLKLPRSGAYRRPDPPKPGERQQAAPSRVLFGLSVVYALTPDGMLRTMLVSNGHDHAEPIPFLAANANARGLIVVDGVAYVSTSNGCGGVANGIWAVDLQSGDVSSWKAGSANIAGTSGPVIAPDGTVYAAASDGRIVALDGKTLSQKAVYNAAGQTFVSSPVLIDINDKDYIAVAAQDGSVHLFDAAKPDASALSRTPGYSGAKGFVPAALATWRDSSNVTWVLTPIGGAPDSDSGLSANGRVRNGAVAAWKIVEKDGALAFDGGWVSRDLESPLPPIIVNGVVFAVSGGSLANSTPAAIYALDGTTGKTLWDSGNVITAAAPATGLSAGGGKVYLGTHDGTLYAFGFPIEH
jgi:outer membrane protein assembly factor BamB